MSAPTQRVHPLSKFYTHLSHNSSAINKMLTKTAYFVVAAASLTAVQASPMPLPLPLPESLPAGNNATRNITVGNTTYFNQSEWHDMILQTMSDNLFQQTVAQLLALGVSLSGAALPHVALSA